METGKVEALKEKLTALPIVKSVNSIELNGNLIERILFTSELLGNLVFQSLTIEKTTALFKFYFNGLSEEARNLFPPYPLFSPPIETPEELAKRFSDWKKESDWTVLILNKDELIIGICLLKRWSTKRPTSGLAVHEEYRSSGLGTLLQTMVNEQALLLRLDKIIATVAPNNEASLIVHRRSGFKETGRTVPHYGYKDGNKVIDRYDIELIKDLKK